MERTLRWPRTLVALPLAVLVACGGSSGDGSGGNAAAGFGSPGGAAIANCQAGPAPGTAAAVRVEAAFEAATGIREPTKLRQAPGDAGRWYVAEKGGALKVFEAASPAGVRTWVDLGSRVLSNGEAGFIGFAFHPDFPVVPEIFVVYTAARAAVTVLSRLVLDDVVNPGAVTEQLLLELPRPSLNHHGGDVTFGPDGYLHVALGDGEPPGGAYRPAGRSLAGSMVRIDVQGVAWPSPGYAIPPDNPWAGNARCGGGVNAANCAEIYALGFRNPWRFSIDTVTGTIWLADVGEYLIEEVNVITAGGDYGWPCREGTLPFDADFFCPGPAVDPVASHDHSQGDSSITGGFVYRGSAIPALVGRYVFGDYVSGRIFALRDAGDGRYEPELLVDTPYLITGFAEDAAGELLFTDNGTTGPRVFRLAPPIGASAVGSQAPDDLAATGCMDPAAPATPDARLRAYTVNAPFWSDGAGKDRYLALPAGSRIGVSAGEGHWDLPLGTVLLKQFERNGRPIETRLLAHHQDGSWAGYSYRWNAAGTAATRVVGGASTTDAGGEPWIFPSEGQCQRCHNRAAGGSLGLTTAQLNRAAPVSVTNQIQAFADAGLLAAAPGDPATLVRFPDPFDNAEPLALRARAWLDSNCAQCHRPGGPTPVGLDLRHATPLAATGACNVVPAATSLGIADARLIAPGAPDRSVLLARLARRDSAGMPPLASVRTDPDGVALITTWIAGLARCD